MAFSGTIVEGLVNYWGDTIQAGTPAPSGDTPAGKTSPERILVVEDDPEILDVIVDTLRDEGFEVFGVANGADAMATAGRRPPDLMLLDMMLPDAAGEAIARAVRSVLGRHIPVLVLSGASDIDLRAKLAEADDYLMKPFLLEDLIGKVRSIL